MKNLLSLLALFWTLNVCAQQEVSNSFADAISNVFSTLDKNRIPHGILLDCAMEFTNVPAFNGVLTDSNYVNPNVLKEIYNTLLMGQMRNVPAGIVSPEVFEERWLNQRSEAHVALSGLYFRYNRFMSNAVQTGKLRFLNGRFSDIFIGSQWQNPYEEMRTFAMTTPIEVYYGLEFKVKVPQNIFYSNYIGEVQKLEIDFADGLGYRQVNFSDNSANQRVLYPTPIPTDMVQVSYAQEGNKVWKYKLTLTNGQTLFSHSKIKVLKDLLVVNGNNDNNMAYRSGSQISWNSCNPGNGRLYSLHVESSGSFNGKKGKAQIFIDDAGNDCKITKPLIVVEGFDAKVLLSPETNQSAVDYINFTQSVDIQGSNIKALISGNSTAFGDQQYDIIYINWDNGLDFMERNALVVEEVIKWVNSVKEGNEKIVVLGQSMGGVVSRYALRDMEQKGLVHNVRLFISQDAPQQGANIPLSVQYLYRNIRNQVVRTPTYQYVIPLFRSTEPINNLFALLDQPATRQLLKNRVTNNYSIDNSAHDAFFANLNAKGFPSQNGIRNVAISNGSECGSTQNFNAGDILITANARGKLSFVGEIVHAYIMFPFGGIFLGYMVDPDFFRVGLLSWLPGNSQYDAFLEDRALYSTGGNKIHDLRVSYTKRILWLIPITVNIVNRQAYQPSNLNLHYDNYAGGFIDIAGNSGFPTSGGSPSVLPADPRFPPLVYLNSSYGIRDKFSLVPTPSALAINAGTDAHYKSSYVGANPPTGQLASPFHNFTTAYKTPTDPNRNNEVHLEFNARNGNWLAAELNAESEDSNCSFLCNSPSIVGAQSLCVSGIYTAPQGAAAYEWQIISGSKLVVLSNANTRSVTITERSPNISGAVTMRVFLKGASTTNGNLQDCSFLDKTIFIGKPAFSIKREIFDPGLSNPTFMGFSIINLIGTNADIDAQGITNIQWINISSEPTNCADVNEGTVYYFTSPCSVTIDVTATNTCGSTTVRTLYVGYYPSTGLLSGQRQGEQQMFNVYPNPSKDLIFVDSFDETNTENNVLEGELYDWMGQSKATLRIENGKPTVNVRGLKKGIYVLRVHTNSKVENHQIIVE